MAGTHNTSDNTKDGDGVDNLIEPVYVMERRLPLPTVTSSVPSYSECKDKF